MELQFKIDGTDYGSPLNWDELKIKYQRDKDVRGLFTVYSSELIWSGKAYKYIHAQWLAGVCDTITVTVNSRCSMFEAWVLLIEGYTILSQIKFDNLLCTASAPIEPDGCSGNFYRNIEAKMDVGSYGTGAGGDAWMEITDNPRTDGSIIYFDSSGPTSVPTLNIEYWTPIGGTYGKTIKQLFSQVVDLASNGCYSFVSDYMDEYNIQESWNIECTGAMTIGDRFTMTWDDILGNTHTATFLSTGTLGFDVITLYVALIGEGDLDTTFVTQAGCSRFRKGECAYIVVGGSATDLELYFHLPPINLQITYPSGTWVLSRTIAGNIGAGNYRVCSGLFAAPGNFSIDNVAGVNWALLAPGAYTLSFKELFQFCTSMWNLGMTIEPDGGGGFQVRIEPIDYFYSTPISLALRNIKDVKRHVDETVLAKTYRFGKPTDPSDTYLYEGNPEKTTLPGGYNNAVSTFTEWSVETVWDCITERDLRTPNMDFICGLGSSYQSALLDPATATNNTNVVTLLEDKYSYMINCFIVPTQSVKFMKYEVFLCTGTPTARLLQYAYYDIQSQPEMCYYNHRNILPEHYNYINEYIADAPYVYVAPVLTLNQSTETVPEGAYFLPYRWQFNKYISHADWLLIISSQRITVNQGNDVLDDVTGYIKSVEFKVSDGLTTFEIESKT